MRKLNYLAIGLTPLLTAVAFAQVLNTNIKDHIVVAQAGQMGGQGQMGQDRPGGAGMNRMDDGRTGDPMAADKDKHKAKGGYHTNTKRGAKEDPQDPSSQARKGKMEPSKPSGE